MTARAGSADGTSSGDCSRVSTRVYQESPPRLILRRPPSSPSNSKITSCKIRAFYALLRKCFSTRNGARPISSGRRGMARAIVSSTARCANRARVVPYRRLTDSLSITQPEVRQFHRESLISRSFFFSWPREATRSRCNTSTGINCRIVVGRPSNYARP